jgi:nucleotide sugar dehydrogenase
MNEIYLACEKLKINFFEVKRLAETKWNFKKFSPGMVGGHCLPVDPYYFTYLMKKNNFKTKIILAGRDINNNIYKFVEKKIIKKINTLGKKINNSKILLMGLAYKENISDIRNSISLKIFKILKMKYAGIFAYDPHLHNNKIQISNSLYDLKNKDFDLVVILVNHKIFKRKINSFRKNNTPILDIFGSLKK